MSVTANRTGQNKVALPAIRRKFALAIAGFMSRGSRFTSSLIDSCIEICNACIKEREKHEAKHCQSCAEAYRKAIEQYKKITEVAAARA